MRTTMFNLLRADFRRVDWVAHWPICMSIVVCVSVSSFIWAVSYPEVNWFMRFWASGATGAFVGLIIGAAWQLRSSTRRPKTFLPLLILCGVVWGPFSIMSLTTIRGSLKEQRAELERVRSISTKDILQIVIYSKASPAVRIDDEHAISRFRNLLKHARIYFLSHEGAIKTYKFEITGPTGTFDFVGHVLERHRNDICLDFQTRFGMEPLLSGY